MLKVPTKYYYYPDFSLATLSHWKHSSNKFLPGTHLKNLGGEAGIA